MPLLQALTTLINPSQFKIYTYTSMFRYALFTKANTSISAAQTMTSSERLKHGKNVFIHFQHNVLTVALSLWFPGTQQQVGTSIW
jgi:hypothetical protein